MKLWKNLDFVDVGDHIEIGARDFGLMPLMSSILSSDKDYLSEYYGYGSVNVGDDFPDAGAKFLDYFQKLEARLIYTKLKDNGNDSLLLWNDGIAEVQAASSHVTVRVLHKSQALVKKVKEYFDEQWITQETKGHIYAIVQRGSSLTLTSIGNAGIPCILDNYTPKVIEGYKYIISDLRSESPSGRISILRGTPGSGKTHLIRAMLLEVPDAMFVLISPEMVQSLSGPELLPLLTSYRGTFTGPIILVLEDADKCLVSRDKNNMSSIQGLLNLGDGILGSLLDLRIVATTNAQELNMEEAIMRPGRLSKMIEVGHLDLESAKIVYKRLLPKSKFPGHHISTNNFKMTLAEVYSLARKNGWLPPSRKVKIAQEDPEELFD